MQVHRRRTVCVSVCGDSRMNHRKKWLSVKISHRATCPQRSLALPLVTILTPYLVQSISLSIPWLSALNHFYSHLGLHLRWFLSDNLRPLPLGVADFFVLFLKTLFLILRCHKISFFPHSFYGTQSFLLPLCGSSRGPVLAAFIYLLFS